jgi:integrase
MSTGGHIRQRSPGSFELRYRVGGKVKTATVRGTKGDAKKRLRELLSAADHGRHVDRSAVTVAAFIDERLALWEVSALTRQRYEERAGMIKRHLGSIQLQKLDTIDIERWHGQLRADGAGRSTIRLSHQLLARVLDAAQRHKMLHRNAARDQPAPLAPAGKINLPREDQIGPVLETLRGTEFFAPAALTIYCGLRRGEMLAVRWSDVDLAHGALTVARSLEETKAHGLRFKAPKTDSGARTISLPTAAVDALRHHRRQQLELRVVLGLGKPPAAALVFPAIHGEPQSPNAFSVRWRRAVARLKLPVVTWHGLRHLHCSLLLRHGVDLPTVSKRAGHSRVDVTARVYAHARARARSRRMIATPRRRWKRRSGSNPVAFAPGGSRSRPVFLVFRAPRNKLCQFVTARRLLRPRASPVAGTTRWSRRSLGGAAPPAARPCAS